MPRNNCKNYTHPKIKAEGKTWYVWFRYLNDTTGKMELIIKKGGANTAGLSTTQRLTELKALKKAIIFKLEHQGWNPITNTYPERKLEMDLDIERLKAMTLEQALNFAAQKKAPDWSHKTKQDYKSKIKYLVEAAIILEVHFLKITELRRLHFRYILDKVKETRKLTAAGYNIYRDYLSSLLGELEELEILEYNPINKIKTKETIKTVAHRPPTKDQRLAIVNRVKTHHYNYYRYLAVLYGTTIRPKEITGLKIKHLHKLEQIFRLTPDSESSTKTKFQRDIPIADWLMDLLSEINLHKYDPEWYIFSCSGTGESFTPGPKRMHSNTTTRWWYDIVKAPVDKGGLGLDVNQYALKKLAGDDMIRLQRQEGVDKLLKLPQMMMGHADSEMTEIYVNEHKEVLKELVKRKMPQL